jgi:hypothetical protein
MDKVRLYSSFGMSWRTGQITEARPHQLCALDNNPSNHSSRCIHQAACVPNDDIWLPGRVSQGREYERKPARMRCGEISEEVRTSCLILQQAPDRSSSILVFVCTSFHQEFYSTNTVNWEMVRSDYDSQSALQVGVYAEHESASAFVRTALLRKT